MRAQLVTCIHGWSLALIEPIVGVFDDLWRKPASAEVPEECKCRAGVLVKLKGVS